jgi:hypothetical protein
MLIHCPRANTQGLIAVILLGEWMLTSCTTAQTTNSAVDRDSNGIRNIEGLSLQREEPDRWIVDPDQILQIGSVDGSDPHPIADRQWLLRVTFLTTTGNDCALYACLTGSMTSSKYDVGLSCRFEEPGTTCNSSECVRFSAVGPEPHSHPVGPSNMRMKQRTR